MTPSPRVSGRGENWLGWEQLEPLVTPGMTGHELGQKVRLLLGLPTGVYQMRIPGGYMFEDIREAIKRCGVVIEKRGAAPIADASDKVIA